MQFLEQTTAPVGWLNGWMVRKRFGTCKYGSHPTIQPFNYFFCT